jgi:GNAT superfamily N-acetyltransferase
MTSIRLATAQDAPAIAHVHVQSWLTTYKGVVPQQYLASLNEAERVPLWQQWLTFDISVFVAEIDGTVVGFASGGPIREPLAPYGAELHTIYLLEEFQCRGIGTALLSAVAKSLIAKDHTAMLAWVLEKNPAIHFYERTGAEHLTNKQIEIGGASLTEIAFGWSNLQRLIAPASDYEKSL